MFIKKPEIIVFAGPNGSGKSTVTEEARTVGVYINADEIKKSEGYFIRCVYVLTTDPNINVLRTIARVKNGGHGVPPEKVIERYRKCMKLIKDVFDVSDVFYLYDNTTSPRRILVKKKDEIIAYTDEFWTEEKISELFDFNS